VPVVFGRVADEQSGRSRRRWWWIVVVELVVVAAIAAVVLTRGDVSAGYQLRAETLVPAELSVRPDGLECPDATGLSPIEFRGASALADTLPLYDGDIVVVRVRVIPNGPAADPLEFSAEWPRSAVADSGPLCAFVLGSDSSASVQWQPDGNGGADFELKGAPSGTATEIEVWLVADAPVPRSSFRTSISTPYTGDDVVIEPVGGRVQVESRSSSRPVLEVEATEAGDGWFEVVAEVTNEAPTTRALDLLLRLAAPGDPTWTTSSGECDVNGEQLECAVGDLAHGESVRIVAQFQTRDGWTPQAVACSGPPSAIGFGLCVEADVGSLADEVSVVASDLVTMERPAGAALTIRTNPDAVVGRAGTVTAFDFELSSAPGTDLGSVVIVGSDCDTVARTLQLLDDGDAFLEDGEIWTYPCELESDQDAVFRLDVAAVDNDGERVSASYEGTVRIIDPALDIAVSGRESTSVAVTNSGSGAVSDVAVSVPGCTSVALVEGDPSTLEVGERVEFACSEGIPAVAGIVALGVDELGLGVVARVG